MEIRRADIRAADNRCRPILPKDACGHTKHPDRGPIRGRLSEMQRTIGVL